MLFERRRIDCGVGFLPKTSGNLQDIHPLAFPPRALIAGLVQLPMMAAAKGTVNSSLTLRPMAQVGQTAGDADRRVAGRR